MRARWSLPYALLFGLLCLQSVTSELQAVQRRQDVATSQPSSVIQLATLTSDGSAGSRSSSNNAKATASSPTDGSSILSKTTASGSGTSNAGASESSTGTAASGIAALSSTTAPVPSTTTAVTELPPSVYKGQYFNELPVCVADTCRESLYRPNEPPSSTPNHTGFLNCWCPDDDCRRRICVDWDKEQVVSRTLVVLRA